MSGSLSFFPSLGPDIGMVGVGIVILVVIVTALVVLLLRGPYAVACGSFALWLRFSPVKMHWLSQRALHKPVASSCPVVWVVGSVPA